jgi:hypothetical protein
MAMIEQATAGVPERAAFREQVGTLNSAPSREQQSGARTGKRCPGGVEMTRRALRSVLV